MKGDLKSAIVLLVTLAIGAALGMVGQGMLTRQRSKQVSELRRPLGFVEHFERVIEPTDAQRDTVRAVLTATAARNDAIIQSARGALKGALDSLQLELAPLLDQAQRDRLARLTRLPDPFRPPPPPGARPPGGPPGGPPRGPPGGPRDGPPPGDRPGGPPPAAGPREGRP